MCEPRRPYRLRLPEVRVVLASFGRRWPCRAGQPFCSLAALAGVPRLVSSSVPSEETSRGYHGVGCSARFPRAQLDLSRLGDKRGSAFSMPAALVAGPPGSSSPLDADLLDQREHQVRVCPSTGRCPRRRRSRAGGLLAASLVRPARSCERALGGTSLPHAFLPQHGAAVKALSG